jgi:hypothetical protein
LFLSRKGLSEHRFGIRQQACQWFVTCLGAAWWELVLEVLFFFEEASFESIFVIMCFKVNKKVSEWFDRRVDEVL